MYAGETAGSVRGGRSHGKVGVGRAVRGRWAACSRTRAPSSSTWTPRPRSRSVARTRGFPATTSVPAWTARLACFPSRGCLTATSGRFREGRSSWWPWPRRARCARAAYVLDEPTAALDVDAMLRLRDAVARLKRSGAAVLIAEHRLWWLRGVADRVVLMQGGRIVSDMEAGEFGGLSAKTGGGWACVRGTLSTLRCARARARRTRGPWRFRPVVSRRAMAGARLASRMPSFQAHAGRVVALIGRNGAGKTTLSRVFAGLHRETAGQVEVCGAPLPARERAGRVYLGMQESGYQLFSDTVAGELESAVRVRDAASRADAKLRADAHADLQADVSGEVAAALDDFGLVDVRERHPLSLSGGQRAARGHCGRHSAGCARHGARRADERSRPGEHAGASPRRSAHAPHGEHASWWSRTTSSSRAPPATR